MAVQKCVSPKIMQPLATTSSRKPWGTYRIRLNRHETGGYSGRGGAAPCFMGVKTAFMATPDVESGAGADDAYSNRMIK